MVRVTERDEFGNANIIGVDSEDLQLSLEFAELNLVTEALNKLANFEDLEEKGLLKIKYDRSHCEICGKPTGTRRFCSNAHKQKSYRNTKASK